jgi:hypothetical protein
MVNNALTNSEGRTVRQGDAETLALKVLGWLAGDSDMLSHFCGATGASPADLRDRAGDPQFLAGVLDFLCLDDAWVAAFAAAAGVPPDLPARARSTLSGGELPHWT